MSEHSGGEQTLPYEELSLPEFAERAAARFSIDRPVPGTIVLRGPCPRCDAPMEFVTVDRLIEGTLGTPTQYNPAESDYVEPLYCMCDGDHPRRPTGRIGCGAYWTLLIAEEK